MAVGLEPSAADLLVGLALGVGTGLAVRAGTATAAATAAATATAAASMIRGDLVISGLPFRLRLPLGGTILDQRRGFRRINAQAGAAGRSAPGRQPAIEDLLSRGVPGAVLCEEPAAGRKPTRVTRFPLPFSLAPTLCWPGVNDQGRAPQ